MNQATDICIAIIEENPDRAKYHAGTLREAGWMLRFEHAVQLDELAGLLESGCPDMVLCGSGPGLPDPQSIATLLLERGTEIPLIALAPDTAGNKVTVSIPVDSTGRQSRDSCNCLEEAFIKVYPYGLLHSKLRLLRSRLEDSEKRCNMLMAATRDAVAWLDEGRHLHASTAYLRLFGFAGQDEIQGTPILDRVVQDDHEKFISLLKDCNGVHGEPRELELGCIRPSGGTFDAVIKASPVSLGEKVCMQIIIQSGKSPEPDGKPDIPRGQDALTGLCNRQDFMRLVENHIGAGVEADRLHTIIYVLLDGMKSVRERFGMTAHDRVISDISRLICDSCTEEDTIARFSDCVFTILHRCNCEEDARKLAETLQSRIGEHVVDIEGYTAVTTCSIGIAAINRYTTDARTALLRSDLACEVARSTGGNRIHVHSTAIDDTMDSGREADWDEMINKIIDEDRLYLVYQPIISTKGDSAGRYEVLLRILDEKGQVILPGQLVSIADRIDQGGTIDRLVIDRAFGNLSNTHFAEPDTEFFIKLCASTLKDRELPAWINHKLQEHRLQGQRIVFEIPEAVAVRDLKNAMLFVKAIRRLRCKVALEHFGCINQPQLIRHLSVDLLKLDGTLINNLASSTDQEQAVRAAVDLAHKSDVQCVAENVDNAADLSRLWECGIDYIQGNFVQEPCRELNFDFSGVTA